jgi:predicted transcriptional regulator
MDSLSTVGSASSDRDPATRWTFVTNHFLVLVCIAGDPNLRVRDIAALVGITERATQAILSDLVSEGYVERIRIGRRNRYTIRRSAAFRHPLVKATKVGEVLDLVMSNGQRAAAG